MQTNTPNIQKPTSARAFHTKWTFAPLFIVAVVLILIAIFGDSYGLQVAVITLLIAQVIYFVFEWRRRYYNYLQHRDEFLDSVGVITFLRGITREDAGEDTEEVYEAFAQGVSGGQFMRRTTDGLIDQLPHVGGVLKDTAKLRVKVKSPTAMEYFKMLPGSVRKYIELIEDYELGLR